MGGRAYRDIVTTIGRAVGGKSEWYIISLNINRRIGAGAVVILLCSNFALDFDDPETENRGRRKTIPYRTN